MKNILIYRSNVGNYDYEIPTPNLKSSLIKITFIDNNILNPIEPTNSKIINRFLKFYIPDIGISYDLFCYIDSNIIINDKFLSVLENLASIEFDVAILPHPWRNNVTDEISACLDKGKINPTEAQTAREQFAKWNEQGFDHEKYPLYWANVIVFRRHKCVEDAWLDMRELFLQSPSRDQFLLPYCLWKNNCVVYPLSKVEGFSQSFKIFRHRRAGVFNKIKDFAKIYFIINIKNKYSRLLSASNQKRRP